jgi:quinol monooxygenase YgiN
MTSYVIFVDFRLKPGTRAQFRNAIDANARASCANEAGCRRFDVVEPTSDADRILLYEIYDTRQAFEEHLKTAHLATFEAASVALVERKTVTECNLVCEGSVEIQKGEVNG